MTLLYYSFILILVPVAYQVRRMPVKLILVLLFIAQCALQPLFEIGDPYTNYYIISCINIAYAMYSYCLRENIYYSKLSVATLTAQIITMLDKEGGFFYISSTAILIITVSQIYFIIRATGGYGIFAVLAERIGYNIKSIMHHTKHLFHNDSSFVKKEKKKK